MISVAKQAQDVKWKVNFDETFLFLSSEQLSVV